MSKKTCYIVGAGENFGLNFTPKENDFVIAADGGFIHLQNAKIKPDLVIGDFDSLVEKPINATVIKLSVNKDDTDTFVAVRKGIELGFDIFKIYCGTGGRTDHTLANIQTLAYLAQNNKQGFLYDDTCVITAISNAQIEFDKTSNGYISIFSFTDKSDGVTINGLKYELKNAVLRSTFPIGVSNQFIGKNSFVSVKSGTLILIYSKNIKEQNI